ncbi:MAG: hypothetical protein ACON4I_00230 [Candidatus Puniceispirillaceae bacterium]
MRKVDEIKFALLIYDEMAKHKSGMAEGTMLRAALRLVRLFRGEKTASMLAPNENEKNSIGNPDEYFSWPVDSAFTSYGFSVVCNERPNIWREDCEDELITIIKGRRFQKRI